MKNKIIKRKKASIFVRSLLVLGGGLGIFLVAPWDESVVLYHRGGYPADKTAGWAIVAFCVGTILYALFDKSTVKDRGFGLYEDHICPNCERVFLRGEKVDKNMCTDCKVLLEPLEGYYDRHPERRDIEEQNIKQEDEDN